MAQERALSDVTDAASAQITRHAYDDLDRRVRTVFPDSDDPIDGSSNGPDGIFDRVEMIYDPNSNLIRMIEQREVVFNNTFDPGNRLTTQEITRTPAVPGTSRQAYMFDSLNRITSAANNFALVEQSYDPLSRLAIETQSIRLDGSGFTRGWENPIQLAHAYDKQSNKIQCRVLDGARTDLAVSTTFDALNRTARIAAQYFDTATHNIATYSYSGPWRVQTKTLGNGAALTRLYDAKRRPRSHQWSGAVGLLVGFEYDYDRMDNVLFERFTHDNGLFDHFQYNDRYEVTGVEYRAPSAAPPANPRTRFFYDDVFNRTQASFGDPFEARSDALDSYTTNKANEYTRIRRNGRSIDLTHDRAGNMTRLLIQPVIIGAVRSDALASARWDAFNLLFDIDSGVTPKQDYRYDPFRRRIVSLELGETDGGEIQPGSRRYIYCGWDDVEERLFDKGATLASAPSSLERIYVNGREIDEPLLAAIDANGDRSLGSNVPKNVPDVQADQEYYFLNNRLGSIMALLNADQADSVLEYYRYSVYGEPTVLQAIDLGGDGREDTPLDLADNLHLAAQSAFGNAYLFAGRRFDASTGRYYFRYRYYDPRSGRFISRDPVGYVDGMTLYAYSRNNPVNWLDPFGLDNGKADCVKCRLEVLYTDDTAENFSESSTEPIPAAKDRGRFRSKAKIRRIDLQAKVTRKESPCCCAARAMGRMYIAKELMPDLNDLEFNSEKAADVISKKLPLGKNPLAISVFLHQVALESLEAEIKKANFQKVGFKDLDCEWQTIVSDANLGGVPTTVGALTAQVFIEGEKICQITRIISTY
jgi:RHS repeat-associated protein